MGKLYIVPTPIGNLEDITLRALNILKEADFILAEDTRKTGFLLKHFQIESKMFSHHKFNEHKTSDLIVQRILSGETGALVSDAGTPAISDPGFLLVKHALDQEVEIECLPGATAFVPALVNSGLPNDRFCFEGFLPQKKGRQKRLHALTEESRTMIFYESPFRLVKTLEQFIEVFGEQRKVSVSRELTKLHEENKRGTLSEVAQHFTNKTVKGEIVIVLEGKEDKPLEKKKNKYATDNVH
ncbi:16S rRNA (cytidine(1402)-2'-O)-methyltransferase [Saccharicrinis fermentans]|uniref:Ribosomal RNA small subunit methyltransferase I n=1 Tax=Saccharicrinis fermentans DSM 9555 = JCM 21142 TaxID=869213 RepID=W7YDJ2_9BACT|nr:16S rRNA (cytidine(1402)-2'-O)-methyltransferase [Saccharicrinis fermentans]GAF02556.1 ribosomal RNA small subunit methyltransferase I [Saccharicrinis fermentans DSM 9555 = JCM 21142]